MYHLLTNRETDDTTVRCGTGWRQNVLISLSVIISIVAMLHGGWSTPYLQSYQTRFGNRQQTSKVMQDDRRDGGKQSASVRTASLELGDGHSIFVSAFGKAAGGQQIWYQHRLYHWPTKGPWLLRMQTGDSRTTTQGGICLSGLLLAQLTLHLRQDGWLGRGKVTDGTDFR